MPPRDDWRALGLAVAGAPLKRIADEYGVAHRTVSDWVTAGRRRLAEAPREVLLAAIVEARKHVPRGEPGREGTELEPGELRRLVSDAARRGDVRAMKLAVELGIGVSRERDALEELLGKDADGSGESGAKKGRGRAKRSAGG